MGLIQTLEKNNVEYEYEYIYNDAFVERARNDLCHSFLKSDCTHLLFIDADIQFNPDDVLKMMGKNTDVICGAYPMKHINWENVYNAAKNGAAPSDLPTAASQYTFTPKNEGERIYFSDETLIPVVGASAGFMLIARGVFTKIKNKCHKYKNADGEEKHWFFETGVTKDGFFQSENYNFCSKWTSAGGEVFVGSWIRLNHVGTAVFGG